MSEIEKMYENAGINQVCNTCELKGFKRLCPSKELCVRTNPTFTAEKQLEILCFIVNIKHSVTFHDQTFSGDKLTLEKIQENLAWAINRVWQDLTEEEKQQIKEILK